MKIYIVRQGQVPHNDLGQYSTNDEDLTQLGIRQTEELKTKGYESVLVIAHSGVSKVFNGYFEGIQDGKFLNGGLKNCEIREYQL